MINEPNIVQPTPDSAIPEEIVPILGADGSELGLQVFLNSEDSAIIFSEQGIKLVLPKKDLVTDLAKFNATLTAALATRLSDSDWLEELIIWFNNHLETKSNEDIAEHLRG